MNYVTTEKVRVLSDELITDAWNSWKDDVMNMEDVELCSLFFKLHKEKALLTIDYNVITHMEWDIQRIEDDKYALGIYYEIHSDEPGMGNALIDLYRGWYGSEELNHRLFNEPGRISTLKDYYEQIKKIYLRQKEKNIFDYTIYEYNQ